MNNSIKIVTEKLKKDKRLLLLIVLGISGMLLLLLSGFSEEKAAASADSPDAAAIERETEERLVALLKGVAGAGRVSAMVTVDMLYEYTYAVNCEGESGEKESGYKNEYVLIESGGDTEGLLTRVTSPVIRGVGIICEGAGSAAVRQDIIRLVSAALGVPVNRIWVSTMKE